MCVRCLFQNYIMGSTTSYILRVRTTYQMLLNRNIISSFCFYSIFIYLCLSKAILIMWIFIELIITLILMPFVIKWRDWGWLSCFTFIGLSLAFTPLVVVSLFINMLFEVKSITPKWSTNRFPTIV